jgi:hypothetical protein
LQEYNEKSHNKLSILDKFKLWISKDIKSFISSQALEGISIKNIEVDLKVFNDWKQFFIKNDIKKINLNIELDVDVEKKGNLSIFLLKIKSINQEYKNINLNVKYSVFKELNLLKEKTENLIKNN